MMKCFEISKKAKRKVIGVLSGTSVDAVDVVLLEIEGAGTDSDVKVLNFGSFPIEPGLKEHILKCSFGNTCKVEDICTLNFLVGQLFAECIIRFCKENGISLSEIDLIGSHGQTICHIPAAKEYFGFKVKSTLQVGEPSVIANLTGITTVGDFRVADVAVGGGGAPLIPYLDYLLFREPGRNKVLLNIGGISNITFLGAETDISNVLAFDTGPGNMTIDALMKQLFGKDYDKDGETASSGMMRNELLEKMCDYDQYFKSYPPKSTGREYYGKEFIDFILKEAEGLPPADIIRTVSRFTTYTIMYNIKKFVELNEQPLHEILVSGGGSSNKFIMNVLAGSFPGTRVAKLESGGINAENKEAVLFAVLANEMFNGNMTNVRSVTGASKNTFLGKICPV
jgi:anhydro-N-acetylmuramic acid kinase